MDWDRVVALGELRVWGQPLTAWLTAAAAALLAYTLMSFALRVVRARLDRMATHTRTQADDVIAEVLAGTQRWLIVLAALLFGLGLLELPERWTARLSQAWFAALAVQLALWTDRLVRTVLRRHEQRHRQAHNTPVSAAATLMAWGARTLLWTVLLLAVLSNLGVNITAFIASLGVGGVAVALAAQNILGDLFASLSIALDKPFEVGDFIVQDNVVGTVEHVGIKSTRIRALAGEQIVVSNTELLKKVISNYKRLAERRVVVGFGLASGTPAEALAAVPPLVKEIVERSPKLRFDRAHLMKLSPSSFDFEVVWIVRDPEFNVHMDEQQRVLLELLRVLAARGVSLASPMMTMRTVETGDDAEAGDEGAPDGSVREPHAARVQPRRGLEGVERRR
jgi:small-conductance mechanosensitive channel